MSKVIDYRIEYGDTLHELESKVNGSLKEGWRLRGDLILAHPKAAFAMFQVMVRYSR